MTYPKELWENTRLEHKAYPIQLFHNRALGAKPGDNMLFLHWHEHIELIVVREGSALLHIDSRPYEVREGDFIFIPGGSLHVGYAIQEGDIRFDCIVFNASLFNEWVHDPVHAQLVAPYLEGTLRFPIKPLAQAQAGDAILKLFDELGVELDSKLPGYQLLVKAKLYSILALLARSYDRQQPHNGKSAAATHLANRDRFKQLIRRLESDFQTKITVEEAAGQVNLNPFHFCKLFKKLTGRTFVEYGNVCRVNEAQRLLVQSTCTIAEIAAAVGCDNPNYFTKLYKQYKGMTPSEARKRPI
jgi:AraC family transcriptional activator of pobA